jgi:hypothetical protein
MHKLHRDMKTVKKEEKIDAYEVAISALLSYESDADTQNSARTREWLADKLNRECQKMVNGWKP